MAGVLPDDRRLHNEWLRTAIWLGVGLFFFTALLALPLNYLIRYGFTAEMLDWVWGYFKTLPTDLPYWLDTYWAWIVSDIKSEYIFPFGVLPLVIGVIAFGIMQANNPYEWLLGGDGSSRPARIRDLIAMKVLEGWLMVLGEWEGKLLRLNETLSALCVAPPGTGKTTGIVVPTILDAGEKTSLIVNDVKPEIFDITSGYRQQDSIVIRLDWAAQDDPAKGIFYARWNPLSPRSMPPLGPERDLYIDRIVNVVIPDPKGSADPHWTFKGRSALAGLIHFLVSKCEAKNNDNLPPRWHGKEPCFPMLLDWTTEALIAAGEEVEEQRKRDPNLALFADPVKNFMMNAVNESRLGHYSQRAVVELTQLANTPEKERGSILSTIDSGINIFKNEAVRQRTTMSDFAFSDIRGMECPETGKMKPVTIYITVNQEDVKSLSVITGLFVETLSAYLVAHKPGAYDRDGKTKLGPCAVMFVLDEFPQMPKLQALIDGPAVGRGQKISYMMIGQDLGQISGVYGEDALNTIFSTTAAKIVLPLNNEKTAERFSKMVGNREKISTSWSQSKFMGATENPFKRGLNQSWGSDVTVRPDEFMGIPKGKHWVLMQGYVYRPIYADTPFYFKNSKFKSKVAKEFGGTYDIAPTMPDFMYDKRVVEFNEEQQEVSMVPTTVEESMPTIDRGTKSTSDNYDTV